MQNRFRRAEKKISMKINTKTISNSKVAIFSDLHLGIYADSEDWGNVAIEWAKDVRSKLLEAKIDTIFFLGDFFHNRTDVNVATIHTGATILDIFKDFNLFVIVGNHDAYYKNRSDIHSLGLMRHWSNIELIDKPKTYKINNKICHFVPWFNEVAVECDYLFGHFETVSFQMNNYKVCDHGILPTELLKYSSSIFSGHFHKKSVKKYSEGSITYVGNTFPMDFNDEGDVKGIYILDLNTGKTEFVENEVSPRYIRVIVKDKDYKPDNKVKGNVVKLVINNDIDEKDVYSILGRVRKKSPFLLDYDYSNKVIDINGEIDDEDDIGYVEYFEKYIEELDLDDNIKEMSLEKLETLYDLHKF